MITWKESLAGQWIAYNDKGESVGCLALMRVGAHMHWCWLQDVDFYMSPGCLECVRAKQKELFKDRKVHK